MVAATPSEVSAPPPATVEMRWLVPSTLRTRPLDDSTMKTSFAALTARSVGAVSWALVAATPSAVLAPPPATVEMTPVVWSISRTTLSPVSAMKRSPALS